MNKYLFAVGALAVLSTACTKPAGDCDTSDTAGCDSAVDTDTSSEGCAEFDGTFAIGVDLDACAAPPDAPDYDYAWGCDPNTNDYTYELYTIGWAKNVELYIDQDTASPWTEYHNSDDVIGKNGSFESYDEDGYWDYYYLVLANSTDFTEVQNDPSKTLYVCTQSRADTLSWFFIANADNGTDVDCLAWGKDASIFDTSGCGAPDWI